MRILLIGDYSNVHATLLKGLRELGHDVVLASDGDGWKNYPRDVDLKRPSLGKFSSLLYYGKLWRTFRKFRNYDVVQIINPVFLPLKAERIYPFYRYLRRHNKKVFMGAFGMDHYYVKTGLDGHTFRYSDFNFGPQLRQNPDNTAWIRDWLVGEKGRLNQYVAADCDGIIAGLYEYYVSYVATYADKLKFIPFPVQLSEKKAIDIHDKVRFFIGIQKERSAYKGTDIMFEALSRLANDYPELVEVVKVESVPFKQYVKLLSGSDVLLDQLYSYTPAMNALAAMAQGIAIVGGGEPENYEILGDKDLFPIVNVLPNEADVYEKLKALIQDKSSLIQRRKDSCTYIERYHDYRKVAAAYLDFWSRWE